MNDYENLTDDNPNDAVSNTSHSTYTTIHYSCGHTGIERLHRIKMAERPRRIQWLEDYGYCKDCRQKKIAGELSRLGMDFDGLPELEGTAYEVKNAEQFRMIFAETCLTPYYWRSIPPSFGCILDTRALRSAVESIGWKIERIPLTAPYDPDYIERNILTLGNIRYCFEEKHPFYILNKSVCRYALKTKDLAVWWLMIRHNQSLQQRLVSDWANSLAVQGV